ncbi:MAG: sporulation protein YqfD [Clostridiales bacterium]|nr:sporulation protein YqfD [Clostridiales bacterium]
MFTVAFMRYMKGTLRFRAYGGYFERFINLAAQNGYSLWGVYKKDQIFYGMTTVKDYKKLAKTAKKAGVRLRVADKKGFPFLVHRYRNRFGLLIGICFFVLFLLFMQNFVWQIDVVGNQNIQTKQIEDLAKSLGLHTGAYLHNINFEQIQREMELQLPNIAWITVNHNKTKVVIELCESTKIPDMEGEDTPSNLVAKKDGIIKYMEIYSGQKIVKQGDIVSEGDLLVSGIQEDQFQQTHFYPSRGKIIAETYQTKTFSQPLQFSDKQYTGQVKKRHYLDLFGLKVPMFLAFHMEGTFERSQQYAPLVLFQKQFPLGWYTLEYKEFQTVQREYTTQEAEEVLLKQIEIYETKELQNIKIISKEMEKTESENSYEISISYTFEEDIAKEEKILLQ